MFDWMENSAKYYLQILERYQLDSATDDNVIMGAKYIATNAPYLNKEIYGKILNYQQMLWKHLGYYTPPKESFKCKETALIFKSIFETFIMCNLFFLGF